MKKITSLSLAAVMAVSACAGAAPLQAFAANPQFSRTAEEWAQLQDNKIEYNELSGLIQEYNVTVQTNQLTYNQFINDYGTSNTDVSNKYRDLADEIYSSLDYPDSSDPTYGYMVSSVLAAEVRADGLRSQADDTLEDAQIKWLTFSQASDTLITVAQTNMITYYQDLLKQQQDEKSKELAALTLQSASAKSGLGMATQVDVLTAQEALQNAQRAIDADNTSISQVRQKLFVMLGWKNDATPEIGAVPAADVNRIAAMNPSVDSAQAIANNYDLKINKRKLENATADTTKQTLTKTIADNEQKIASSVNANYQNVLSAKLAYDVAVADAALENQNLQIAARQLQNGLLSQIAYQQAETTAQNKQIAVQIADLTLFQTMETYDWGIKGLASAS